MKRFRMCLTVKLIGTTVQGMPMGDADSTDCYATVK